MSSSPQIQSPIQTTQIPVQKQVEDDVPIDLIKNPPLVKMCVEHDNMHEVIKKMADKSGIDYKKNADKLRLSYLKSKIWPAESTINVGFMKGNPQDIPRSQTSVLKKSLDRNGISLLLDPIQYDIDNIKDIRKAIIYIVTTRIQPIVNTKFNFYDPTDSTNQKLINPNIADIRIDFDANSTCWSLLGTDCLTADKNKATMNFSWFDSCIVLHEFCHALGMVHEHSNINGIPINWAVCSLQNWTRQKLGWDSDTIQKNIIDKYEINQYLGNEFDPKSIMLYFYPGQLVCKGTSKDLGVNTTDISKTQDLLKKCQKENLSDDCIVPGNVTNQNLALSPRDVLHLNTIYKSPKQKLTPPQFTVKFFNDVYNQQIDIDTLINPVKIKPTETPAPPASKSHALRNKTEKKPEKKPLAKLTAQHALKQPGNEDSEKKSGKFYERLYKNIMNGNFANLFTILFLFFWIIFKFIPNNSFLGSVKDDVTNIIGLALVVEFMIFYIAEISYGFNVILYKLLSIMESASPISIMIQQNQINTSSPKK